MEIADKDFSLSIVIPVFNEEASVAPCAQVVSSVLAGLGCGYELIFVDDGSSDGTSAEVKRLRQGNPKVKLLRLSRNFGKERALTAGLHFATGDAMIPMDVDLQDPPELIAEFVAKWREGYDVVYGVRRRRDGDGRIKKWTALGFYRLFNRLTEVEMPVNAGDYRLMDRRVVDVIKQFPERNRFMKGIFAWVGFRQVSVMYDRPPRRTGESRWNYWRLWNFALDGITGFSTLPLRWCGYVGFAVALFAMCYALFLFFRTLIYGVDLPGYASIMVVMLFLGGIQMLTLGILGEYIGRLYMETKQRPIYIVSEAEGF